MTINLQYVERMPIRISQYGDYVMDRLVVDAEEIEGLPLFARFAAALFKRQFIRHGRDFDYRIYT